MTIDIDHLVGTGAPDIDSAIAYQEKLVPEIERQLTERKLNKEQVETLISKTATIPRYPNVLRVALGLTLPPEDKAAIESEIRQAVEYKLGRIPEPDNTYKLAVSVIMDNEEKFPNLRKQLITSVAGLNSPPQT